MKALIHWLQDRTGIPGLFAQVFHAPLPGGPRWHYTWASLILGAFLTQAITGFFLWTHYSASTVTAWESMHHLQNEVAGGWLLRGLHHFGAQAFVVLLGIYILQLVLRRAVRAPGEVAFWTLLLLVPLAVGLSVTGWMLPYDQHGFWAARVPLNILSITPVVGEPTRVALLGGQDVSHLTLTRFLSLHAGLLPAITFAVLLLHWLLSWRRTSSDGGAGSIQGSYWPDQAWRDAVVLAAFVGLLVTWTAWRGGAPLGAPADPSQEYAAARPEWFFLWLFQLLKYFRGGTEVWGAVVLPTALFAILALTPWIASTRAGRLFNGLFVGALTITIVTLTALAFREDARDPVYAQAREQAHRDAERARQLASSPSGIPAAGGLAMVHSDPIMQGPKLFARHCASCHRFDDHDGLGREIKSEPSAPDLHQFASRSWLTGLLDPEQISGPHYFGGTKFANTKMAKFVKRDVADFDETLQANLKKAIIALSAEAQLPSQADSDATDAALIAEGGELLNDYDLRCTECHRFREYGEDPSAPDLTGYGSRPWMIEFVRDPAHPRFYGDRNDRMPRFGVEEVLTDAEIGLIVDWLRLVQ
jgi:ubiquinol-cytochrome c reductase cytochrome b subunit